MMKLHPGMLFHSRYKLIKGLGKGSFGEVWLAHDERLDLEIAIKVYIALDDKSIEEFRAEYKIAYNLNHPNLLHANYYDVFENSPYLVMAYCQNGSSESMIGTTDEMTIWRFIRDVAGGLAYLHGQEPPLVHQDIKPANILIDKTGRFVITDFGISKRIRSSLRKASKRAAGAGTVAYMGPERFSENPAPVKASDIWSLGATVYELMTDDLPFSGMGGGMMNSGAVVPQIENRFSRDLNDVVRNCLSRATWERPTAAELVSYAEAKMSGRPARKVWLDRYKEEKQASGKSPDMIGIIEQFQKNEQYKDAYNLCLECIKKGEYLDYAQDKCNELIPILKKQAQNDGRMNTIIAIVLTVVMSLVLIFLNTL